MLNLSREKAVVYVYVLLVFGIIFGLSFGTQGDKITAAAIVDTADSFGNFSSLNLVSAVFVFLMILVFVFFVLRYFQEYRKQIHHTKMKPILSVVALIMIVAFVSFGVYFGDGQSITGYVPVKYESITGEREILIGGKSAQSYGISFPKFGEVVYTTTGTAREVNTNFYFLEYGANDASQITATSFSYEWDALGEGGKYRIQFDEQGGQVLQSQDPRTGDWDTSMFDPTDGLLVTQAKKQLEAEVTQERLYTATWFLLNEVLGSFAVGAISDYCEEQYESSEYDSPDQEPVIVTPDPDPDNETCSDFLTTLTAQGERSVVSAGFTFRVSYTVRACKENVQYTVYLSNDGSDRIAIANGAANLGDIRSENELFSYIRDYHSVCLQVSDASVGDGGYKCFSVV